MYHSFFLRCDEWGYKSLLDCMIIDVERRRCMTRLRLPLVNELRKTLVENNEVCYLQQPGEGKLKTRKLKNIKKAWNKKEEVVGCNR